MTTRAEDVDSAHHVHLQFSCSQWGQQSVICLTPSIETGNMTAGLDVYLTARSKDLEAHSLYDHV